MLNQHRIRRSETKPQPKEKDINSLKNIPQLKESESKLSKAYEVLIDFDHKKFLEGAKFAFETIINAFNNSDKKTLKSYEPEGNLSKKLYKNL